MEQLIHFKILLTLFDNSHESEEIDFFQVMIQPHNRHSTMSLYLATIAVVDTVILALGT